MRSKAVLFLGITYYFAAMASRSNAPIGETGGHTGWRQAPPGMDEDFGRTDCEARAREAPSLFVRRCLLRPV